MLQLPVSNRVNKRLGPEKKDLLIIKLSALMLNALLQWKEALQSQHTLKTMKYHTGNNIRNISRDTTNTFKARVRVKYVQECSSQAA